MGHTSTVRVRDESEPRSPAAKLSWRAIVRPYEEASNARAAWQLFATWAPLAAVFYVMHSALSLSLWITLALSIPAAGFLVRTFIVMHDCGHGSFFSSRRANSVVGWIAGVMTLTPFAQWRRDHALHHASSGDLDRRGHGDVRTLTVREYTALSPGAQFRYRMMRHPAVLFGLGPLHIIVSQRVPDSGTRLRDPDMRSVVSTNLAIAIVSALAIWFVGWRAALLIYGRASISRPRSESGCSTCSTNSKTHIGSRILIGIISRRRFVAAPISSFRPCCGGSRETSVFTTYTI